MNITEALNVALPDIPARTVAQRHPCLDPGATFKEHVEDGKPVVRVYLPSEQTMLIDDVRVVRARIYISEYQISKSKVGYKGRIEVEGMMRKWTADAISISTVASEIDENLADRAQYKELNPPNFYLVDLRIENGDGPPEALLAERRAPVDRH